MALDESAVSALLDALRAGEGTDLVRELAQWALQQLIDAEAAEMIGAGRWERTRSGSRTATGPARGPVDQGRRPGVGDPEAAQGLVLPGAARAPPPDRPGPLRGGDGGLRQRGVDPIGR